MMIEDLMQESGRVKIIICISELSLAAGDEAVAADDVQDVVHDEEVEAADEVGAGVPTVAAGYKAVAAGSMHAVEDEVEAAFPTESCK